MHELSYHKSAKKSMKSQWLLVKTPCSYGFPMVLLVLSPFSYVFSNGTTGPVGGVPHDGDLPAGLLAPQLPEHSVEAPA